MHYITNTRNSYSINEKKDYVKKKTTKEIIVLKSQKKVVILMIYIL